MEYDWRIVGVIWVGCLSWLAIVLTRRLQRECSPQIRRDLTLAAAGSASLLEKRIKKKVFQALAPAIIFIVAGFIANWLIIAVAIFGRFVPVWLQSVFVAYPLLLISLPVLGSTILLEGSAACSRNRRLLAGIGPASIVVAAGYPIVALYLFSMTTQLMLYAHNLFRALASVALLAVVSILSMAAPFYFFSFAHSSFRKSYPYREE